MEPFDNMVPATSLAKAFPAVDISAEGISSVPSATVERLQTATGAQLVRQVLALASIRTTDQWTQSAISPEAQIRLLRAWAKTLAPGTVDSFTLARTALSITVGHVSGFLPRLQDSFDAECEAMAAYPEERLAIWTGEVWTLMEGKHPTVFGLMWPMCTAMVRAFAGDHSGRSGKIQIIEAVGALPYVLSSMSQSATG